MSQKVTHQIACPACGKKCNVTVWNSVNSQLNPELVEKILDGSIFDFKCPACGHTAILVNAMLFHDMKHNRMIQLVGEGFIQKGVHDLTNWARMLPEPNRTYRVVDSINDFREKVQILLRGYDDRVIEIIKMQLRPDVENKYGKVAHAHLAISNESQCYEFYDEVKLLTVIDFDENQYEELKNKLRHLPDNQMIIDSHWARKHLYPINEDHNFNTITNAPPQSKDAAATTIATNNKTENDNYQTGNITGILRRFDNPAKRLGAIIACIITALFVLMFFSEDPLSSSRRLTRVIKGILFWDTYELNWIGYTTWICAAFYSSVALWLYAFGFFDKLLNWVKKGTCMNEL